MKKTNVCPKCNGTEILKVKGSVGPYCSGNNIQVGWSEPVLVNRYVCCKCGYSEEWIDLEDIPELKNNY